MKHNVRLQAVQAVPSLNLKLPLLVMLLMVMSQGVFSQTLRGSNRNTSAADTVYVSIEEKLVSLALDGPMYQAGEHQNKINEYTLKSQKQAWLNLLTLSANYNDQTFAKTNPNNAYVYPKFFTGINIPLGTILSRTGVKSARESVAISKINQEQLARNIRTNVLSKYRQYTNFTELIANQREVVDDYQAAYEQAKNKFSEDKITIEVHNTASKNYNDEYAKLLELQLQQEIVRLEIENMIGVDLETVIASRK